MPGRRWSVQWQAWPLTRPHLSPWSPPEWRQGLGESRWVLASQELQAPAWPEWGCSAACEGGRGHCAAVLVEELGRGGAHEWVPAPPSHYRVLCGPLSRVQVWLGCRHQYVLTTCLRDPSGHLVGVTATPFQPGASLRPGALLTVLQHQPVPQPAWPARGAGLTSLSRPAVGTVMTEMETQTQRPRPRTLQRATDR